MKKLAILYYPRAVKLQRRGLWLALPTSIIAALGSALTREHSDFAAIVGLAIFTFAALCFGVWGVFMLLTEVALMFDPKRRDDMWSWWYALLSILIGLAFVLSSVSWLYGCFAKHDDT